MNKINHSERNQVRLASPTVPLNKPLFRHIRGRHRFVLKEVDDIVQIL